MKCNPHTGRPATETYEEALELLEDREEQIAQQIYETLQDHEEFASEGPDEIIQDCFEGDTYTIELHEVQLFYLMMEWEARMQAPTSLPDALMDSVIFRHILEQIPAFGRELIERDEEHPGGGMYQ